VWNRDTGNLLYNHVQPGCGMYTGLSIHNDSICACTITGSIYDMKAKMTADSITLHTQHSLTGKPIE
jgi:hypothetical protein